MAIFHDTWNIYKTHICKAPLRQTRSLSGRQSLLDRHNHNPSNIYIAPSAKRQNASRSTHKKCSQQAESIFWHTPTVFDVSSYWDSSEPMTCERGVSASPSHKGCTFAIRSRTRAKCIFGCHGVSSSAAGCWCRASERHTISMQPVPMYCDCQLVACTQREPQPESCWPPRAQAQIKMMAFQ